MNHIQHFLLAHLEKTKMAGILVFAFLAGEIADVTDKHPAFISAMVGGLVAVTIKLLDVWWEKHKATQDAKTKTIATADKVLEIETQDKRELREAMNRLRAEEKLFAAEQLMLAKAETFEARERAHRFGNEVMRLQNIILGLQNQMANAIPPIHIPEISFTPYHELMFGNKEDQKELQRQQAELREQMMRDETRTSGANLHITKSS